MQAKERQPVVSASAPPRHGVIYAGSTANNLVWPFYRWGGGHGVLKDNADPDPARRHKMLFTLCTAEMSAAGITQVKPGIHRVGPEFASWPSSLSGNPYQSLQVGPNFRATL